MIIYGEVEKIEFGNGDRFHGCLSCYIYFKRSDGGSQAFGGFGLGGKFCSIWFERVFKILGIDDLDDAKGKIAILKMSEEVNPRIIGIGALMRADIFIPSEEFKK